MSKRRLRSWLAAPAVVAVWEKLSGAHLSLFTLHRFAVPDLGVTGHDPVELAQTLEQLRRNRIAVLPLGTVVEALRQGTPLPRRAAVFTVDDGYFDFAEIGAPVFERYDCPVTVFVVTGFVDGACWLWWDKLSHLLAHSDAARVSGEISARCTALPHRELLQLIDYLALELSESVPETPPDKFRPMAWATIERLARQGVTFGPHTVTHPVLPRTTAADAASEISGSWNRLRAALNDALPVFSYPNGEGGRRELDLVRAAGLHAAVSTAPRYLSLPQHTPEQLYQLPRFAYPDQPEALLLTAAGFRLLQGASGNSHSSRSG